MRSDRQELPEGFTKEEADKAEVQEAKTLASSRSLSRNARSAGATTAFAAAAATDCMNYWPRPDLWVCGAIRVKYDSLGGPSSFLLWPTSNELVNPDSFGRRQTFQNGPMYWSAAGGAHPVVNHFFAAWGRKGYEGGSIGYPTTDEIVNPDGVGRRQHFTGAIIYWKFNEAYSIGGAILDKWGQVGYEGGLLGYPTSDEKGTPDGVGRFNTFEYGSVYWSAPTGAHPVYGPVLAMWAAAGYERGTYGYPIEDTVGTAGGGDSQRFQHGTISVSPPNLGSPPWRVASDKSIGPNYNDALECVGGYDNGPLTFFHSTGETLYCKDFRHIYEGHFPGYLTEKDWNDFQTCLAYTLASTERGFSPNQNNMYGRTRYNTYSNVRSYAVVRGSDQSIYTAYTSGDGGRDWSGCRKNLS